MILYRRQPQHSGATEQKLFDERLSFSEPYNVHVVVASQVRHFRKPFSEQRCLIITINRRDTRHIVIIKCYASSNKMLLTNGYVIYTTADSYYPIGTPFCNHVYA